MIFLSIPPIIDNTLVSVIEAIALGLPVVAINVGGMLYLIEHQKDRILVDANDAKAMADEIGKLIENSSEIAKITQNARNKAADFDWNVVKNKWIKVLNDV